MAQLFRLDTPLFCIFYCHFNLLCCNNLVVEFESMKNKLFLKIDYKFAKLVKKVIFHPGLPDVFHSFPLENVCGSFR